MTLLLPFLLVAPLLMLATAVVALAGYGPLGWLAALLLVVTVAAVIRCTAVWTLRWWRSTKAPVRLGVAPPAPRPGPATSVRRR